MTIASQCWNFGILVSRSGVAQLAEQAQLNGTLLAIAEINERGGIDGRRIRPIECDPGGVPPRFAQLAERLVTKDSVNVIFGGYLSSQRKAVLPIVREHGALLCYPTMYEGFEFSDNVIYSGAAPNQNNSTLAKYMLENCGDTFSLIGSDYLFPREASRVFRETVTAAGARVVSEEFLPLEVGRDAIRAAVLKIVRRRPKAIFGAVVGRSTVPFYEELAKATAGGSPIPVGSLNTNEAEIAAMGPQAASGHLVSMPYFSSIEGRANISFRAGYRRRYGSMSPITSCSEAAYFQVHSVARAIGEIGTDAPRAILDCLRGSSFAAPQGEVRIDEDNNHTYLWPRIARVTETGCMEIVQEASEPMKPDPYLAGVHRDNRSRKLADELSALSPVWGQA